jgi:hypothetical protein
MRKALFLLHYLITISFVYIFLLQNTIDHVVINSPEPFRTRRAMKKEPRMTILTHLPAFAGVALRAAMPISPRFAVSLIDRRTGDPHLICDMPLRLTTDTPALTASELMRNRDPDIWDIFVERLDAKGAIQ